MPLKIFPSVVVSATIMSSPKN
uniref:Uncharacterized protein n=1 Tax=Rhizophora mucronata TaxID=61149 RepID=A0A2P2PKN2_RHIMU